MLKWDPWYIWDKMNNFKLKIQKQLLILWLESNDTHVLFIFFLTFKAATI